MNYKLPNSKKFAFTIVDDTDGATIQNIKPIYDLLEECNMRTTKTVWVHEPKDSHTGETLKDKQYLEYIKSLKSKGFEIALHNIGSGIFTRDEILNGLNYYKTSLGEYPNIQINHSRNYDSIYWGYKRFSFPLNLLYKKRYKGKIEFLGDDDSSPYFWGDFCKENISYIRNFTFNEINTSKVDPKLVYRIKKFDKYSNYWFSSSDGFEVNSFTKLISKDNVDRLESEGGICIVYTHFASGFLDENGCVNKKFEENLRYIASKDGLFVPASELLDIIVSQKDSKDIYANSSYLLKLQYNWLKGVLKKVY